MRVLQLVHGFPPRERAGTEVYTARLAAGLRGRGHAVHTVAATQRPGAPMYSTEEEPGLTRIVNNAPYAGLRRAERDPAVRAILRAELARFRPDVVHVQHLRGLDVDFFRELPPTTRLVWTLHDAWAWCAAGGLLLRDGAPCPGPGADCPRCASAYCRDGPLVGAALATAGGLAHLVPPAKLHAAWKRLPAPVRGLAGRGAARVNAEHIESRREAILALAQRARLVSPSRWLAETAVAQGLPGPVVVPHGVEAPRLPRVRGGPLVFLGTLAAHKGPHLVVEAHRRAGVDAPLHLHGPPGPDAAYVASLPSRGPVDDPFPLLAGARALVLGSTWPENAPLVVLEARAVGCPVIAPAAGGIPELVEHGRDGLLYPPGDVDALAAAIRQLCHAELDAVRPPPSFSSHLDQLHGTVY